jgi:alpha-L-rhamnosidase
LGLLWSVPAQADMRPLGLLCEYLTNPLGVDVARPRLSWQLRSDERGARQVAYQILVARSEEALAADQPDVWDSGRVASDRSLQVRYGGPPLVSAQRYYWKVRAWDGQGHVRESAPAWWGMGLLEAADWHGAWIGQTEDVAPRPAPMLRREFSLAHGVAKAQLFVSGLGYADVYLNGERVGDHVLDPGYTAYDRRVQYVTHDVTAEVEPGANVLGVMLGTGWYNAHSPAVWGFDRAAWRAAPKLLLELRVTYEDGSEETIFSDEAWQTAPGPVTYDSIYGGESYDARLAQPGWSQAGFDASTWSPVTRVAPPAGPLVSPRMPPVRVTERLAPRSVREPKPGVYVFDFGQNIAGVSELTLDAPAGTKVTLRHGERLKGDGSLDVEESRRHMRGPMRRFQTSQYIASGRGQETWAPRFTYYGFQYVEVRGLPAPPSLDTLHGLVLHTDVETAGSFSSSNPLLDQIQQATRRSYLSNLVSVPTDCPHREKNAWTGDAHLAAEQAMFNFKPAAVYTKWIEDLVDAQREDGALPGIAPTSGWGYDTLNGPAWDSALLLIPYYLYQYYGDRSALTEHFDAFERYLAYLGRRAPDGIADFGLNDWMPYRTKTPAAITSTAYYYQDLGIAALTATLRGEPEKAKRYQALAGRVRDAFDQRFYDPETGSYGNGSQTALSIALVQGLVPPDRRDAVTARLAAAIAARGGNLDTGVLGARAVLLALLENGRAQLAYELVDRTAAPGWGHWMAQGATTLWEDWRGNKSRNHVFFGDVSAWFYKALAGIQPDPDSPGWGHILVRPHVPATLDRAGARYDSIRGPIESQWHVSGDRLHLTVEIPANTRATISLPTSEPASVRESGKPVAEAAAVERLGGGDGVVQLRVGSGRYAFTARGPHAAGTVEAPVHE